MKNRICLGLMSGTSVDGIDASILLSGPKEDHLLLHVQFPYSKALRADLLHLIGSLHTSLSEFTRLHYAVGEAFAQSAERTIKIAIQKKFLKNRADLQVIGSHGQTIFHHPEEKRTLQIGEASLISVLTGISCVSDFRMADTAAGGEGAPLLPIYHQRLFQKEIGQGLAVHNLGGISNFTYLGPKKIFALDTGPANCLLDLAVQIFTQDKKKFDAAGSWARSGSLNKDLLKFLLDNRAVKKFCRLSPPKSTGRELFSKDFLLTALACFPKIDQADILHTLSVFSVELMFEAYKNLVLKKNLPLKQIVFCGGGTGNRFLLELLAAKMPKVAFYTMEDYGFSSQAMESQAFGYFALCALDGKSISLPSTTGVKEAVVCGKISPGKNWGSL